MLIFMFVSNVSKTLKHGAVSWGAESKHPVSGIAKESADFSVSLGKNKNKVEDNIFLVCLIWLNL